jgi:hypothetical protein
MISMLQFFAVFTVFFAISIIATVIHNPTLKLAVEAEAYVTTIQDTQAKVAMECAKYNSSLISAQTLAKLANRANFTNAIRDTYPQMKTSTEVWIGDRNALPNATICMTAAIDGAVVVIQPKPCKEPQLFGICFGGPVPDISH